MAEAPVARIETWSIEELVPYANNPMLHSPEQVAQIAASMAEFGQTQLVIVDPSGEVIAGHGRIMAAQKLGWTELTVGVASGWSEDQRRAYRIADNQIGRNSTWRPELLKGELQQLKFAGFDMPLLGFDELKLVQFMANPAGKDPNAPAPEPPPAPVTRPGDIWVLGSHRLACGDATRAEDVAALLAGAKPHLMVTDPPYGVDYDPGWRDRAAASSPSLTAWADRSMGQVRHDDRVDWAAAWSHFPGDAAYVWHGHQYCSEVSASLLAVDLVARTPIVWRKQHFAIGRGDYHWQHEACWYAVRKGRKSHWQGARDQSTVWDINTLVGYAAAAEGGKTAHSTQKPIDCMRRPIENNSAPGEAVYDPFVGSGTTLVAAELTARRCYALELDPGYCDIAVGRWVDIAKQDARLASSGATWHETAAARGVSPTPNEKRPQEAPGAV